MKIVLERIINLQRAWRLKMAHREVNKKRAISIPRVSPQKSSMRVGTPKSQSPEPVDVDMRLSDMTLRPVAAFPKEMLSQRASAVTPSTRAETTTPSMETDTMLDQPRRVGIATPPMLDAAARPDLASSSSASTAGRGTGSGAAAVLDVEAGHEPAPRAASPREKPAFRTSSEARGRASSARLSPFSELYDPCEGSGDDVLFETTRSAQLEYPASASGACVPPESGHLADAGLEPFYWSSATETFRHKIGGPAAQRLQILLDSDIGEDIELPDMPLELWDVYPRGHFDDEAARAQAGLAAPTAHKAKKATAAKRREKSRRPPCCTFAKVTMPSHTLLRSMARREAADAAAACVQQLASAEGIADGICGASLHPLLDNAYLPPLQALPAQVDGPWLV